MDTRAARSVERPKRLRAVRPNAGIRADYDQRLRRLIDEMHRSVLYWLKAAYRRSPPRLAQDAPSSPAEKLQQEMRWLSRKWLKTFEDMAPKLADHFATAVEDRSTTALKKILRDGGMTVKFRPGPAVQDIMRATVNANVSLIRSIAQEHLGAVEGIVMRSVQTGRDLGTMTKALEHQFGVTKRRVANIALDQNNKATSAFLRVRQEEAGIDEAIWMHSHAGKQPRPTHVAMDGQRYKVSEGMYDKAEGRYIWPGELINCRCTSRPVVAGFS